MFNCKSESLWRINIRFEPDGLDAGLRLIRSGIYAQLDRFIATWLTIGQRHVIGYRIRTAAIIENDHLQFIAEPLEILVARFGELGVEKPFLEDQPLSHLSFSFDRNEPVVTILRTVPKRKEQKLAAVEVLDDSFVGRFSFDCCQERVASTRCGAFRPDPPESEEREEQRCSDRRGRPPSESCLLKNALGGRVDRPQLWNRRRVVRKPGQQFRLDARRRRALNFIGISPKSAAEVVRSGEWGQCL